MSVGLNQTKLSFTKPCFPFMPSKERIWGRVIVRTKKEKRKGLSIQDALIIGAQLIYTE